MNLIPHTVFKKMGKCESKLQPHNMVLSSYEGNANSMLLVIQVKLDDGTTLRIMLFLVIDSKENFNLLLRQE